MANSLLTIDMITKEAVRLFKNSNAFLQKIDRQYSSDYAKDGAKIGDTLRIRLPNDYITESGPAISALQDTTEQQTSLTVSNQEKVAISFTSAEQALSLDDFSNRILKPAVNALAGKVAADVMALANEVPNLVFKDSGGLVSPDAGTFLDAGAAISLDSGRTADRCLIVDPRTQSRTVDALKGLFNPNAKIGEQYSMGQMMGEALGFDWLMDQTVLKHTNGTSDDTDAVDGAGQSGTTITVTSMGGTLNKGDVITFAGVYAVNRVNKQSTGELRQFTVTADVAATDTEINIFPALTPQVGGFDVAYQTVVDSPADAALITLVAGASTQYRKNLSFLPEAFTLATADLPVYGKGVVAAARESFDGVSMRTIQSYDVTNDRLITRLDVLYGFTPVRPEWACIVADAI